jgi:hypothetical protein
MKSLASSFGVLRLHAVSVIVSITITTTFYPNAALAQKGGGGAAAAGQSQAGGAGGGSGGATPYFETEMLAYGAAGDNDECNDRDL